MNASVKRIIRSFVKDGDALIDEFDVSHLSLAALQKIFNARPEDTMYESYKIGKEEAAALSPLCKCSFNLGEYDYYLESEV
jgi:hypothetical protein